MRSLQFRSRTVSDPLAYFVVAAKHEHISRAAEELGISQPALSRSIARLEEAYGTQLFDRFGRGVRLNAAGRLLLQHVQRAISELEDAAQLIQEQTKNLAHMISIGFLGTFGGSLIPDLIRGFNDQQGGHARFCLLQGSHPFLLAKLESREIELCISAPGFREASIERRRMYDEELFLVVPSTHRLANRGEVDLLEIANEPMVMLKPQYGLRQVTDEICERAGFAPIIAFEAEEVTTLRGLAGAGAGVALAPRPVLVTTALTKDLKVRSPRCERTVVLSWRKDRRLSLQARGFRDFVLSRSWSSGAP